MGTRVGKGAWDRSTFTLPPQIAISSFSSHIGLNCPLQNLPWEFQGLRRGPEKAQHRVRVALEMVLGLPR